VFAQSRPKGDTPDITPEDKLLLAPSINSVKKKTGDVAETRRCNPFNPPQNLPRYHEGKRATWLTSGIFSRKGNSEQGRACQATSKVCRIERREKDLADENSAFWTYERLKRFFGRTSVFNKKSNGPSYCQHEKPTRSSSGKGAIARNREDH